MGTPRYIVCNSTKCNKTHDNGLSCWRKNHIPYVGVLLCQYGTYVGVWQAIFIRYMRMKKFAWPDEVKAFNALYFKKHPELKRGHKIHDAKWIYELFGAVCVGEKDMLPETAFKCGYFEGVLSGDPITPKDSKKDLMFLKLSGKKIKEMCV